MFSSPGLFVYISSRHYRTPHSRRYRPRPFPIMAVVSRTCSTQSKRAVFRAHPAAHHETLPVGPRKRKICSHHDHCHVHLLLILGMEFLDPGTSRMTHLRAMRLPRRSQLFYQNYQHYTPVGTMIRLFPMFITGIICNFIIAVIIARVSVVWILGSWILIAAD